MVTGDSTKDPNKILKYLSERNGDAWYDYFKAKSLLIDDAEVPEYNVTAEDLELSPNLAEKVKAHNELIFLRGDMTAEQYIGNLIADIGAKIAAEDAVNDLHWQQADNWISKAFMIALRIAILE